MQNKILDDAKNYLLENNFESAINSFYNVAYNDESESSEKKFALEELIKIHSLVGSDSEIIAEVTFELATLLFDDQEYFTARDKFEEIVSMLSSDNGLYGKSVGHMYRCLLALKQSVGMDKAIVNYLDYLILKRKCHKGKLVVEEIKSFEIRVQVDLDKYLAIFGAQHEDFDSVAKILKEYKIAPTWWNVIEREILKTGIGEIYNPVLLYHAITSRKQKINSFSDIKSDYIYKLHFEMYRYIFEGIVYFPDDINLLYLFFEVFNCFSSKRAAELLKNYLEEKESVGESLVEVMGFLIERDALDGYVPSDKETIDDETVENQKNNTEKIESEFEDSKVESVVGQVLGEMNDCKAVRTVDDVALEKVVIYMSSDDIRASYKDIIVSLLMLESYPAIFAIINRATEILKENEHQRLLEYFKIVALYKYGRKHEALSLIDFACNERGTNEYEVADLMYIKAEIYRGFGKTKEALKIYKEICSTREHRLVKQRILEIERR